MLHRPPESEPDTAASGELPGKVQEAQCCVSTDELPESLRLQFPLLAERLYLATYTRTLDEYQGEMGSDVDHDKLCNTARHAALLAVQNQFKQDSEGNWHLQPVGPEIRTRALNTEPNTDPRCT